LKLSYSTEDQVKIVFDENDPFPGHAFIRDLEDLGSPFKKDEVLKWLPPHDNEEVDEDGKDIVFKFLSQSPGIIETRA
jgi:hypothetical protein